jgi:membrane protein YdbS with pleckstrin-like domain
MGYLGLFLVCLLLAAAIVALPIFVNRDAPTLPNWSYAVAALFALAILAIPIVKHRTNRFRITNYRIDFERGFLWKKVDTLELWHVDDLSFSQGPLDRLFGLGTITVVSDDRTTPRLAIPNLPNARPTFDSVKQRVIAVKRQRGVLKMDMG